MPREMRLSSGEVGLIAGLPKATLNHWINRGLVAPANNGQGTGNHRTYSILDAVAIAYGAAYREAGCGPETVTTVVQFIANLSHAEIKQHFDAGETLVAPLPGGPMWFKPSEVIRDERSRKTWTALDLKLVYDRVLRKAENIVLERV